MKYSVLFATVFASYVAAQSSSSSAQLPIPTDQVPPCVLQCTTQAASTAGCSGIADTGCICNSSDFLQAATGCITTKCTTEEQAAAIQLQSQLCANAPTDTSAAPSATATATATATPSPSASASGSATRSSSGTATAPASSVVASASSRASSLASHASSAASAASSVVASLSSAAASATGSGNGATALPVFNLATAGVWAAVALGGAAAAQLAL
ncbi:hypothetical protein FRC09_013167 [Ceratobasidium sp. 395]|nr:hypothetical protein FRC09_013167 [Ceratobasidium sp. 395]